MSQKKIISKFENRGEFQNLLKVNPGLVIIKLGASWCKPCHQIRPVVEAFFASSPPNVVCCDIDVDESFDLYAYFKTKKMVNGIPAILCYKRGNMSFAPDDSVVGSGAQDLSSFFRRCGQHVRDVEANPYKKPV